MPTAAHPVRTAALLLALSALPLAAQTPAAEPVLLPPAPAQAAPPAPAADAPPPPIRDYIRSTWDTLSRSMTECKSVRDPKVTTAPILYLPAGMPVPPAVQKLHADCGVEIQPLPKTIHQLGDLRPERDLKRPGLLYLPNKYVVPGGRFNEMYGWDSYFIVLGLLSRQAPRTRPRHGRKLLLRNRKLRRPPQRQPHLLPHPLAAPAPRGNDSRNPRSPAPAASHRSGHRPPHRRLLAKGAQRRLGSPPLLPGFGRQRRPGSMARPRLHRRHPRLRPLGLPHPPNPDRRPRHRPRALLRRRRRPRPRNGRRQHVLPRRPPLPPRPPRRSPRLPRPRLRRRHRQLRPVASPTSAKPPKSTAPASPATSTGATAPTANPASTPPSASAPSPAPPTTSPPSASTPSSTNTKKTWPPSLRNSANRRT